MDSCERLGEEKKEKGRKWVSQAGREEGHLFHCPTSRVTNSKHQKCGFRPQKCGKNVAFETKNMAKNMARFKMCSSN
jgi:hypothetical protein